VRLLGPALSALVAGVAMMALGPGLARADEGEGEPPKHYFYKGYDYGSQALYNPLSVIINRGFDTLQLRPNNRSIYKQSWLIAMRNVGNNVRDPFTPIAQEGWGRFLREEIFPLSFTLGTARWAPNYSLHLIGGGQTYAELREWYEDHDAPAAAATVFSIATLFTAAFLNEAVENRDVVGPNTDCLADLYVFDLGGVLLFSVEPVRRFFSRYVILSDWSLQPAVTSTRGELHNVGNYYAAKLPLPYLPRVRLFALGGYSTMPGISYLVTPEYSVSVAAGWKVATLDNGGDKTVQNFVSTTATAGLFLDRNDSLLASFQVSDIDDYFLHLNVYPNTFGHMDPGIGFWSVMAKDGRWLVGISMTRSLGFGVGGGTL
jgi:hypothetical protein